MRIFPLALIAVGVFGVLEHFGLVDPAFARLFWPLLLIGIGAAMLARGPRWRADWHERMHDRWERRMHRHFGPGWAKLSEEERARFRAGMRQRHPPCHDGGGGNSSAPAQDGASLTPSAQPPAQPPAPGGQR